MQVSADTLSLVQIKLDPDEPTFQEAEKDKIAKQQGKPLLMEEAMSSIVDTNYLTGEDYILEINSVDTWFTDSNGIFGFILIGSVLVCIFIPLVVFIIVKYFGLKVHFGKMNPTVSKLVTTATVLRPISTS